MDTSSSMPKGWGWQTAPKNHCNDTAPTNARFWTNRGTTKSVQVSLSLTNEYWVRLKPVTGYNATLTNGTTTVENSPIYVSVQKGQTQVFVAKYLRPPHWNPLNSMTLSCMPDGKIKIDVPDLEGTEGKFAISRGRGGPFNTGLGGDPENPYPFSYVEYNGKFPLTDPMSAVPATYSYQITICHHLFGCNAYAPGVLTSPVVQIAPCATTKNQRPASIGVGFGEDWVTLGGLNPGQVPSFKHNGAVQNKGLEVLRPPVFLNWYAADVFAEKEVSQHLPMDWTYYPDGGPSRLFDMMQVYKRNWKSKSGIPPLYLWLNEPELKNQGNVSPQEAADVIVSNTKAVRQGGGLMACCGTITHTGYDVDFGWLVDFLDAAFAKHGVSDVREYLDVLTLHLYEQKTDQYGWITESPMEFDTKMARVIFKLREYEGRYPGISKVPIFITEMTAEDPEVVEYLFEFMRRNDPKTSGIMGIVLYGTNTVDFGDTGAIFTRPAYADGVVTFNLTHIGRTYVQERYKDLGIPVPPELFEKIKVPVDISQRVKKVQMESIIPPRQQNKPRN